MRLFICVGGCVLRADSGAACFALVNLISGLQQQFSKNRDCVPVQVNGFTTIRPPPPPPLPDL